jgi:hypothetical protein
MKIEQVRDFDGKRVSVSIGHGHAPWTGRLVVHDDYVTFENKPLMGGIATAHIKTIEVVGDDREAIVILQRPLRALHDEKHTSSALVDPECPFCNGMIT